MFWLIVVNRGMVCSASGRSSNPVTDDLARHRIAPIGQRADGVHRDQVRCRGNPVESGADLLDVAGDLLGHDVRGDVDLELLGLGEPARLAASHRPEVAFGEFGRGHFADETRAACGPRAIRLRPPAGRLRGCRPRPCNGIWPGAVAAPDHHRPIP